MVVGEILSALKLLQWGIDKLNGRISKADRQKIEKEAERLLVQLATTTEIDKYIAEPRQHTIDRRVLSSPRKKTAAKKVGSAGDRMRPRKSASKRMGPRKGSASRR
jgi:hypothetical protein